MEGEIGQYLEFSSHVNAVVDWFGPTDFLIMDQCGSKLAHDAINSPESQLIGGAIQDHPQKFWKRTLFITSVKKHLHF